MAETPKLAIQCGFFPILFSSYSFLLYLLKKKMVQGRLELKVVGGDP